MKPNVIFLIDGLTNINGISGDLLLTEVLSEIEMEIKWYNYVPTSTKEETVETIDVFPLFFDFPIKYNPGRAGLEFLLDKENISHHNIFAVLRTNYVTEVIGELQKMEINVRVSNYSNDKKTLILSTNIEKKELLMEYFDLNKEKIIRLSHFKILDTDWYRKINNLNLTNDYCFVGYCHGGLLSALKISGLQIIEKPERMIHYIDSQVGYYSPLITDTIISRIQYSLKQKKIPVIYFKHFAHNARKGIDKNIAAQEVGKIILGVIRKIERESIFNYGLMISDHNSENGVDETKSGMTKIGTVGDNINVFDNYNPGASQQELIEYLKRLGVL